MKGIFIIICLIFAGVKVYAQPGRALLDSLARKTAMQAQQPGETSVYLAANKDVYIAGEDLWYNAFVLDPQTFALAEQDHILYLQLIKDDTAVWKEMYPITHGISAGHVYLPQTLQQGKYLLKAYTARSVFAGQPWFYAVAPIQIVQDPRTIKNNWQFGLSGQAEKITFFPEGGALVPGVENTVAFKAETKDRQPANLKAKLLRNGSPIADIETSHAGMGLFRFTPEANATYTVNDVKLPAATAAVSMQLLKNENDSLTFKITGTKTQNILLRVHVRGTMQLIASGVLKDSLRIKMSVAAMPPGIAEATLFNDQLEPLATRLLYLHPQKKLNIRFSHLKETYAPKEQISVKISTTDENGRPVPTALSLRVYDRLFNNRSISHDVLSHYYLTSQLRSPVYDAAYYFDSANTDKKAAMDLLLLTQHAQQAVSKQALLPDSLKVIVSGKKKISLMLFNYSKSINQVASTNEAGIYYLSPENLSIGQRFFIKYFSDKEYKILVTDPFDIIDTIKTPLTLLSEKNAVATGTDTNRLQYGNMLKEVIVQSKGRGFGDRYFGYLDSIARFEGNTDYVGQCGWLNCPACGSGTKPVEGVAYSELLEPKRSQVNSHPFSFTPNDMKKEPYHYPQYTEEELLKKFKMVITKGFHQHAPFYSQDYNKEDKSVSDTRNALYWNPVIVTDDKGEATISFFSSDIRSGFIGVAEGVSGNGYIGTGTFNISVR